MVAVGRSVGHAKIIDGLRERFVVGNKNNVLQCWSVRDVSARRYVDRPFLHMKCAGKLS